MANAKVSFNGVTLIDLSNTTATANTILNGFGAYGADGNWIDGVAPATGISIISATWADSGHVFTAILDNNDNNQLCQFVFEVDEEEYIAYGMIIYDENSSSYYLILQWAGESYAEIYSIEYEESSGEILITATYTSDFTLFGSSVSFSPYVDSTITNANLQVFVSCSRSDDPFVSENIELDLYEDGGDTRGVVNQLPEYYTMSDIKFEIVGNIPENYDVVAKNINKIIITNSNHILHKEDLIENSVVKFTLSGDTPK